MRNIIVVAAIICTAAAVALVFLLSRGSITDGDFDTSVSDGESVTDTQSYGEPVIPTLADTGIITDETKGDNVQNGAEWEMIDGCTATNGVLDGYDLGNGLEIHSLGAYSGEYIENGDDGSVNGVATVEIANIGTRDIQYAQITVTAEEEVYSFKLTTLPSGSSVLLESQKKEYVQDCQLKYAVAENVAPFVDEGMNLMSDVFIVTGRDYTLNITNKSDRDYNGAVTVYFKQTKNGKYFCGITYSATLVQGIKAGQSVIIPASHFKIDTSKVMFVTAAEE